MNRIKEFYLGLTKSTRITLISCGCFVLLTFVILLFFVLFPITPSETAIAKISREGLVYQDGSSQPVVTTVVTTTDVGALTTEAVQTSVTTSSTPKMTFTTRGGYLSEGYIPTGEVGETYTETTTETAQPATEAPQEATEAPTEAPTEVPTANVQIPTDPPAGTGPVEIPTMPPLVTQVPTQPPTNPPAETDPPAEQITIPAQ